MRISINKNNLKSFKLAYDCDPVSAFGGIICFNFKIKKSLANLLNKIFLEVVIANGFDKEALKILKSKKNIRLIDSQISQLVKNLNLNRWIICC